MKREFPELAYLLSCVEEEFGRKPITSGDFDELTAAVDEKISQRLSTSTLKRLWGYISPSPRPRIVTLNMLSEYIGYRDFQDFCDHLHDSESYSSLFFTARTVFSRDLKKGDTLKIGWAPDRMLDLKYLGDSLFEVQDGGNSHLVAGDRFYKSEFFLGKPLYIGKIIRGKIETAAYVAGKTGGLNLLKVSSKQ